MHKAEQEGPANKGLQGGKPIEAANTAATAAGYSTSDENGNLNCT
jgi:hypothetical protein